MRLLSLLEGMERERPRRARLPIRTGGRVFFLPVEEIDFLEGADNLATLNAFRAMGVNIDGPTQGKVVIHGVGLHGLKPPAEPLDLGNSGTSMRLLAGLLAAQRFDCTLTGDASLSKRPMKRVTEPLATMGARIRQLDA